MAQLISGQHQVESRYFEFGDRPHYGGIKLNLRSVSTRLHGAASQKTAILFRIYFVFNIYFVDCILIISFTSSKVRSVGLLKFEMKHTYALQPRERRDLLQDPVHFRKLQGQVADYEHWSAIVQHLQLCGWF
jgi:hypothetical protein